MRSLPPAWETLWPFLIGPSIWALHFLVCYVTAAVYCAKIGAAGDFDVIQIVVGIATATALAGIVWAGIAAFHQWRVEHDLIQQQPTEADRRQLLGQAGMMLCGLSLVGVIYVALPALFIDGCR